MKSTSVSHDLGPGSFALEPDETHLRILQTTDIHVNLLPYDYFTDAPDPRIGLSQLVGLIEAARQGASNSLLFETGDFLQGTPLGDIFASRHPNGAAGHPAITMMNAIGYDAGTLGNHEFNYGLEFLERVLGSATFPFVLSNAARKLGATPERDEFLLPPSVILERSVTDNRGTQHTLKIGVIGFVPPQIAIWDRHHLENRLYLRGITQAARSHVPLLRAAGADLVIALSHSGIGHTQDYDLQENASIPLAAIDGIDAVLCGHQHGRFPGPQFSGLDAVDPEKGTLHGKPAVMAGFWGSDLGVIDLALSRNETGKWGIRRHKCTLHPIPKNSTNIVPRHLTQEHSRTLNHIRTAVARTAQPLHSYFTFAGFDLATRAVAIAQKAAARSHLGRTELPLLSAASPFRAGGKAGPGNYTEIPQGELTLRGIADLYQFPNTLSVVRVTSEQLYDWLERSAGKFRQIKPEKTDQVLLNSDFPSYYSDVILGLDYEIDLLQPTRFDTAGKLIAPDARRVRNLRYKGSPLLPGQEFLVATNSFRAGGGGGIDGAPPGELVLSSRDDIRTALTGWIRQTPLLRIEPVLNWRFTPVAGASVLLHTAPRARDYRDQVPLPLSDACRDEDGFAVFRLPLSPPLANPQTTPYIGP